MITLANAAIKLTVRPDLGGRIDQLHDVQTGHEWLWHSPGYDAAQTRNLAPGASFDQQWTGGWDEIFPNDAAAEFQGRQLVDHGELWSQSWDVVDSNEFSITLSYTCQTVPVRVQKTIALHPEQPEVTIDYQFHNQSDQTIPFLFKQHAAIAVEPDDEIILPECQIEPVDLGFSKIIGRAEQTRFPKALAQDGQEIDLRRIPPPSSQLQEFYYSSNLAIGQCGIRHTPTQSCLLMQFDTADFPYVWVFQSYGGWQGHYVVVLEPCTNIPWDLEVAHRNGTAAQLRPQETQRRRLTVRLQH